MGDEDGGNSLRTHELATEDKDKQNRERTQKERKSDGVWEGPYFGKKWTQILTIFILGADGRIKAGQTMPDRERMECQLLESRVQVPKFATSLFLVVVFTNNLTDIRSWLIAHVRNIASHRISHSHPCSFTSGPLHLPAKWFLEVMQQFESFLFQSR
jgi:hypothetical protein